MTIAEAAQERLCALPVQVIAAGTAVILKRGCTELKITGDRAQPVVEAVLAALTGEGATLTEVCEPFASPDRPAVQELVEQLRARRIVLPADTTLVPAADPESAHEVFYWHFARTPREVAGELGMHRIVVLGVNAVSRRLTPALAADGATVELVDYPPLRNTEVHGDGDTVAVPYTRWLEEFDTHKPQCLVVTSDYGGMHGLRQWNQFCVERGVHFLPVVLQNLVGYIGPLVVPGETACYECLRMRQNSHLDNPADTRAAEYAAAEGRNIVGFHPSMPAVLAEIAALELTKFYGGRWVISWRAGVLIEVSLIEPSIVTRKVLKVPRCPVCGPGVNRSDVAIHKRPLVPHD